MRLRPLAISGPSLLAGLLLAAGCASAPTPARAVRAAPPPTAMGSASDALVERLARPFWAAMPSLDPTPEDRGATGALAYGSPASRARIGSVDWSARNPADSTGQRLTGLVSADPTQALSERTLARVLERASDLREASSHPPTAAAPDPLGRAFNPEGDDKYVPRDWLVPATGSLDFGSAQRGTAYGRIWRRGEEFGGLGFGFKLPAGRNWFVAAEVGIDPDEQVDPNQVTLLLGISKGF